MRTRWLMYLALTAAAIHPAGDRPAIGAEGSAKQVLIVVGPSRHPPGTHEVAAGGRLIEYMLEHAEGVPPIAAEVVYQWPAEESLDRASTIVFIGDLFPGETLANPAKVKADLARLMGLGRGMVCVHYATGLQAKHVTDDGDHPLLGWIGGYFATGGCKHCRSVARICPATLTPEPIDHPVLLGWKAFHFDDEPYWNNYFGREGPARNVTPLVSTMLPPEAPKKETVVWAVERADGGRGVGIVVPHYFRNWKIADLRTLVLNGICWTAKLPIPPRGVRSSLPDLATFRPASVEPQPPKKNGPAAAKQPGKP